VRTLTIEAASPESAEDFLSVLADFTAEAIETGDSKHLVSVAVTGDREIVELLNVLEEHVSRRGRLARVEIDGQNSTLHPQPA